MNLFPQRVPSTPRSRLPRSPFKPTTRVSFGSSRAHRKFRAYFHKKIRFIPSAHESFGPFSRGAGRIARARAVKRRRYFQSPRGCWNVRLLPALRSHLQSAASAVVLSSLKRRASARESARARPDAVVNRCRLRVSIFGNQPDQLLDQREKLRRVVGNKI